MCCHIYVTVKKLNRDFRAEYKKQYDQLGPWFPTLMGVLISRDLCFSPSSGHLGIFPNTCFLWKCINNLQHGEQNPDSPSPWCIPYTQNKNILLSLYFWRPVIRGQGEGLCWSSFERTIPSVFRMKTTNHLVLFLLFYNTTTETREK